MLSGVTMCAFLQDESHYFLGLNFDEEGRYLVELLIKGGFGVEAQQHLFLVKFNYL